MADIVCNIAKGRAAVYHDNVEQNVPTGCKLVLVAIESTNTDDERRDVDTLSALLALGSTLEVTNSGYGRIDFAAGAISQTVDDSNNWVDQDIDSDPVFSSIVTGDDWTHLVVCYSPGAASADSAIIPLTVHDFVISPNGGDITANISANGYYRAS